MNPDRADMNSGAAAGRPYYLDNNYIFVCKALQILLWLGALVLITSMGWWNLYLALIMTLFTGFLFSGLVSAVGNLGRPFIILEDDGFWAGRPRVRIAYADLERYAFDPATKRSLPQVGFCLWPRPGATVAELKGGGPLRLSQGKILCRTSFLGRGATAGDFIDDFAARLRAAEAADAFGDSDTEIKMNPVSGEAVILPKGPLARLIRLVGEADDQNSVTWFSFNLGTAAAIFLGVEAYGLWTLASEGLRLGGGGILPVFGLLVIAPLLAIFLTLGFQSFLIDTLGRARLVTTYISKAGEVKKFILGATLGLGFCLLTAGLILAALIMIWKLF